MNGFVITLMDHIQSTFKKPTLCGTDHTGQKKHNTDYRSLFFRHHYFVCVVKPQFCYGCLVCFFNCPILYLAQKLTPSDINISTNYPRKQPTNKLLKQEIANKLTNKSTNRVF